MEDLKRVANEFDERTTKGFSDKQMKLVYLLGEISVEAAQHVGFSPGNSLEHRMEFAAVLKFLYDKALFTNKMFDEGRHLDGI